jgi:GNAT superfamily N-acetyltransferase
MKGLRLFVRPIEPADGPALANFLGSHPSLLPPACGLLGKLLGDIVSMVTIDVEPDSLRVTEIIVAEALRRKWIGRAMMREVELLARKLERSKLIVDDPRDAGVFLQRVGFELEGERWVRHVGTNEER